jgi:mannan endo-1,4-beta-mannosidase
VVEVRTSSDADLEYNISSNSGDSLQYWIEDMAAFVKSVDPVHLLTVGEEGFFGPSTPLYLYANPGPWAQLEGVDFVRNHRAPGIDFASIHVYVDQWLCTERGKDAAGRDAFFSGWLDSHQQAAEEELGMPVVGRLYELKLKLEVGS